MIFMMLVFFVREVQAHTHHISDFFLFEQLTG